MLYNPLTMAKISVENLILETGSYHRVAAIGSWAIQLGG